MYRHLLFYLLINLYILTICFQISEVIKCKEFLTLPTIPIELLQNSIEEKNATNTKHMCDMVLDWVKTVTEDQNLTLEDLCQKVRIFNYSS